MTTHILNFGYTTGQTLAAQLFALGSDTVAATASSVTEATNRKGRYAATFSDVDAGDYLMVYFIGGTAAGSEYYTSAADGESLLPWSERGLPVNVKWANDKPLQPVTDVPLGEATINAIRAEVIAAMEAQFGHGPYDTPEGYAKEDTIISIANQLVRWPYKFPSIIRSIADVNPIKFHWPVTGVDITGHKQFNGGSYSTITADITELDAEDGVPTYLLPYSASDRPTEEGVVSYRLTDGAYTHQLELTMIASSPGNGGGDSPTGPGGISVVIPVTLNNQPVDGVAVWITTDPEGTNQIAGTLYTDTFGNTDPAFTLEAGIFYVWTQKAGVNFTNPQPLQVLENGTYQWYTG